MSGHSKWSSIKHKKGAADAKRGKLFSKLARALIVAAREGGGDPAANLALANAIEKARSYSMPKENIERAIARGSGADTDAAAFEQVVYEGYGPSGVAVLVEALTDNRNRTAQEVRTAFTKHEGSLGGSGAVAWLFERRGVILVDADRAEEDDLTMAAADGGADDVELDGSSFRVTCTPEALTAVRRLRQEDAAPDRRARGERRRAGGLRQLRHPGTGDGGSSLGSPYVEVGLERCVAEHAHVDLAVDVHVARPPVLLDGDVHARGTNVLRVDRKRGQQRPDRAQGGFDVDIGFRALELGSARNALRVFRPARQIELRELVGADVEVALDRDRRLDAHVQVHGRRAEPAQTVLSAGEDRRALAVASAARDCEWHDGHREEGPPHAAEATAAGGPC